MTQPASKLPARESLIEHLRSLLGERVSTSSSVLEQHGRGESWHPVQAPDAVCFVQSTGEVADIVKLCAANATPVIAYGTGTSLEGQVQAVNGGICIDLGQMNQVLEINNEDMDCINEYLSALLDAYGEGDPVIAEVSVSPENFQRHKQRLLEERESMGMSLEGLNC